MSVPCCAALQAALPVNEAGRLNYWLDSFYWLGIWGAVGYMGDSFHVLLFSPQEAAGFVFSFKYPLKKKIRAIIRRREFVHGSFPKHLMSISASVPGRVDQVSAGGAVGEEKKGRIAGRGPG